MSGKYPRHHPDDFADLAAAMEAYVLPGFAPPEPVLDAASVIRTQGSCFAENVHRALLARNMTARHMAFPEVINSPLANRLFFDRVAEPDRPPVHVSYDTLFPREAVLRARDLIPKENAFIFTAGVAGCWFEKKTGVPAPQPDTAALGDYEFRWLDAETNARDIAAVVDALRRFNPDLKIVLTLSPVPLNRAFGYDAAVVGDCISKSTLRVALARYLETAPEGVYYWPSFEAVRWLGAHSGPVFGTDDGVARHVSAAVVDIIVDLFLKYFVRA